MPQVSTVRVNGTALRGIRTRSGLTVRQLAAKAGRHPQSVRRLETGAGKLCSEVFAHQLANALKVEIGEFTEAGETSTEDAAAAVERDGTGGSPAGEVPAEPEVAAA